MEKKERVTIDELTVQNETYEISETNKKIIEKVIQMAKMFFVSLPVSDIILKDNYERVLQSKTIGDLFFSFTPLMWKFLRNKDVSDDDKMKLMRIMMINPSDKKKFQNAGVEDILDDNIFGEVVATTLKRINEVNTTPASEREKYLFGMVKNSIDSLDKAQTVPIDKLLDPEYFPEVEQKRIGVMKKKEELCIQVENIFMRSTSEQLEQYIKFFENDECQWNGWEITVGLEDLPDEKLKQFIKLYDK